MSATEELRRLLDERGVEWVDTGDGLTLIPAQAATNVAWDVNTWPSAKDMGDCLWVQNRHPLTPEQAIAATIGSEREAELQKALDFMRIWISEDAHLGESAISCEFEKAEGLRKLDAIESAIAATLGSGKLTAEQVRDAWCGNLKRDCLYDPPTPDWQAIADELNAIGGGECEMVTSGTPCIGNTDKRCTSCGAFNIGEFYDGQDHIVTTPRFCPNCGKAVKR